jgi:hypothetical protein
MAWLLNESPVKDDVVINDRWGKDSRHKHGGYWTTEYTPGMADLDHVWEESRGMGFSYGYNRAERIEHYHSGRELVIMLIDLVSRGGNLLLDIGPAGDGTIPVIMEERLLQIGDFLKVNGDAIYGTKPWKSTRQWSAGEVEKVDYNKEFSTTYDVTKLTQKPAAGKAGIEAFFTSKGKDVYAILPRWSEVGDAARFGCAVEVQGFEERSHHRHAGCAGGVDVAARVGVEAGAIAACVSFRAARLSKRLPQCCVAWNRRRPPIAPVDAAGALRPVPPTHDSSRRPASQTGHTRSAR